MLGKSDYTLTCGVSGAENLNSTITYQWTKNNGTQTQVGTDSTTLFFFPLKLSDAGQYTCQATVSSNYLISDISIVDSYDVRTQSELNYIDQMLGI